MPLTTQTSTFPRSGFWNATQQPSPCTITRNNFIHKSLSCWSLNYSVGCGHGCLYCYVPSTSTNKLASKLAGVGVNDPDAEWGNYVFLRPWDEDAFLRSLRAAEAVPVDELNGDGNRAVLISSTSDAYQVAKHQDPEVQQLLQAHLRHNVRRSLELIRNHSTLNVRILTRSPLVREDFDLLASFGNRVLLGMSIPTLRSDLARIYEPHAPSPRVRLETLAKARAAGIPIFAAMAPTYPECDEEDLRATLSAIAKLQPTTIFHEPINIRASNVARIAAHAKAIGASVDLEVFASRGQWQAYALSALRTVEKLSHQLGLDDGKLHLWPDQSLISRAALLRLPASERESHVQWIYRWWDRVSAWPTGSRSLNAPRHERI